MSSDSEDTPEDTPAVRVRTRDGDGSERATTRTRVRRHRKLQTDDPPPPTPRHPMDPGPTVNWPELPRNADGEPEPVAVQQRMRDLFQIDTEAGTEFILETLHMLLLQHRPTDDIARIFGVSTRTVWRWRKKLREKQSEDFRARVPTDAAAEQVANIKRTKAMAWQQAARCAEPLDKLRWVTLTLKCEQEIAAIYEKMKMYRAVEPRHDVENTSTGGAASLARMAEEFLIGGYAGAAEVKQSKGKKKVDPDDDLVPEVEESDSMLF